MILAKDLGFDHNENKILHVGKYKLGKAIQMTIEDGNQVSLRKGDIKIEVQDIKKTEDGTYCGKVQYVEPYKALSEEGVDEGVDISFSYKHIFACQH